ncbi:MAG: pantoate--beta-alanine ligase [Bacteroidales bacterium]|nr:pantoate--beta-alanine ligase [Bacteroidales bacterium]
MIILRTITETKQHLLPVRSKGATIGFVPTMGALHEGHLTLIRKARNATDHVVASIFVNPIQFNNPEDLLKYPREEESDIHKLKEAGCDMVFLPSVEEMYPVPDSTVFDFGQLDKVMEGKFRPGHFNGVAIVVKKLFEIIEPDQAFFGEKDFQQVTIIQDMVRQLHMAVRIVACETVREADGLAMSSRNKRLTPEERAIAPAIHRILSGAVRLRRSRSVRQVKEWVQKEFQKVPAFTLEYFEIVNADTLVPVEKWTAGDRIVGCVAAYLGKIRLIDNIEFI